MQWSDCYKVIFTLILTYPRLIRPESIAKFVKPNPLPKYFSIDIDGTFYTKDEAVFQKNVEALKKLKDNNITPFFCTGRHPESIEFIVTDDFKSKTNYNGYPGIYGNGTLVYDSEGNLIKVTKLSEELLTKYKTYADSKSIMNLTIFMTDQGRFILEDLAEHIKNKQDDGDYKVPVQTTFDDLKQKNVVLIYVNRTEIDDFVGTSDTSYVKYNNFNIIHLTPKDCSKKNGLEALLTHLNSNKDECAYIGDTVNDQEGMEFCKISFAVGNSDDETKRKAKWVLTKTHDEGAFAEAVQLLFD